METIKLSDFLGDKYDKKAVTEEKYDRNETLITLFIAMLIVTFAPSFLHAIRDLSMPLFGR